MKKVLCIVTALIVVMMLMVLPSAAEETEIETEVETVAETESVSEETEEVGEAETSEEPGVIPTANFIQRIWEYVVENKTELITTVIGAVFGFIMYLFRGKFNKTDKMISKIKSDTESNSANQTQVINAVNAMIEGYNDINAKTLEMYNYYQNRQAADEAYAKTIAQSTEATVTVLAIMQYVYSNSKNLPQPTKDMVNYLYVKALKDIESDESMKALVDSMKVTENEESN